MLILLRWQIVLTTLCKHNLQTRTVTHKNKIKSNWVYKLHNYCAPANLIIDQFVLIKPPPLPSPPLYLFIMSLAYILQIQQKIKAKYNYIFLHNFLFSAFVAIIFFGNKNDMLIG